MAFVASTSEITVVNIVAAMAIDARPVASGITIERFVMAFMAVDITMGMGVGEFKICFVVVESPDHPGVWIVANRAILAKTLFVDVVRAMTVDALVAGVAIGRRVMAGFAAEHRMLTDQRKAAEVMVETNPVLP